MKHELSEIIRGVKRTLSLIAKERRSTLLLATGLMIITGFLTNLPAVILGKFVDRMMSGGSLTFNLAAPTIFLIIGIILAREAITVYRKYLVEDTATQTEKTQTVRTISHLLKINMERLGSEQIGSWHGKIFRSIQGLIRLIKLAFLDFFPTLFTALAALAIALWQKPLLGFFMLLVIPAGLFIIIKQISSQKGIRISLLRSKEKIDGRVVETLNGIETVRALNTVDYETERVEEIADKVRAKEIKHHFSMALFDSAKYLNEGLFYVIVISISIVLAAHNVISRGDILVYSILFLGVIGPLREIHRILDEAHESSILVNDLYGLLNEPQDQSYSATTKNVLPKNIEFPAIKVENLSFSFGDKKVLDHINLSVRQGEVIGIAGASGCGKSTFVKILLRLIHEYSGDIYLKGQDLPELTRESLAKMIGYVPQKPYIFAGTARENISYGANRKVEDEEITEAARLANIWSEVEAMSGGLDANISEGGGNISGGQRQRLAIARLILRSPEIIILDEATSALDNSNEHAIQRNIESVFRGKTIIIIAHRLTTLRNCDRILVFDKGKIAQEGNYIELSKNPGLFKQFLEQKDEKEV